MAGHSTKGRAKNKRKVASNGKRKTSSHNMGGKNITETKAQRKKKKAKSQLRTA